MTRQKHLRKNAYRGGDARSRRNHNRHIFVPGCSGIQRATNNHSYDHARDQHSDQFKADLAVCFCSIHVMSVSEVAFRHL